jgi:hypothetical protein
MREEGKRTEVMILRVITIISSRLHQKATKQTKSQESQLACFFGGGRIQLAARRTVGYNGLGDCSTLVLISSAQRSRRTRALGDHFLLEKDGLFLGMTCVAITPSCLFSLFSAVVNICFVTAVSLRTTDGRYVLRIACMIDHANQQAANRKQRVIE